MEFGEAFGAIAALQKEGPAAGNLGQGCFQAPRLAGEDEGRKARQPLLHVGQRGGVRILRYLPDGLGAPAVRRPFLGHDGSR